MGISYDILTYCDMVSIVLFFIRLGVVIKMILKWFKIKSARGMPEW